MTAAPEPKRKSRVPRSLGPLRHANFRRMWIGAFVSNIGTWVETVAVGIYITERTGRASWTGIVAAAAFLPGAFFSPIGGALADRIPRKVLLIVTTLIEAASAAALAVMVAFDAAPPLAVTAIVFVAGSAGMVSWPTFSAILPELVTVDELPSAMGLASAQWNLGRVVGPIAAGVVIAIGGYDWAFALNALSFVAVIIAVLPVHIPKPTVAPQAFVRSIRSGVAFAYNDRGVRNALTLLAINSLFAAAFIALVPAVALKLFDNESPGTSILVTAQGVGAVLMALTVGAFAHRFGMRRFLAGVFLATAPALVVYALSPTLAAATIAIAVLGALYLGTLSGVNTVIQMRTPSLLRGRVISLSVSTLSLLYPVGSVVQGWLGDQIGLRVTTLLAAGALIVALVVMVVVQRGFAPGVDLAFAPGAPGRGGSAEPDLEVIPD